MAHENLPFTLNVENKNWQPIFGNQELGTFFMIYVKIHTITPMDREDPNTNYIFKLSFRIQNFSGAISIGFAELPEITFDTQTENPIINCYVRIKLSPFSNKLLYKNQSMVLSSTLEKGYMIDTDAILGDVPASVTGKNNQKPKYINPIEYSRNGDDLDAIISIEDKVRLETLDKIDTFSKDKLKRKLESLLTKGGIAGGHGICCPKWATVI